MWRVIEEAPAYSVSDSGEVKSNRTDRVLKPFYAIRGDYPAHRLWVNGKHITRTVHKLVMEAFVGPRPAGYQVRHLDGNPRNSSLTNLTYGTVSENREDSVRHGTHAMSNRTHCPQGHEYSDENTILSSRGGRLCRICQRNHKKEWARRNRLAQKGDRRGG